MQTWTATYRVMRPARWATGVRMRHGGGTKGDPMGPIAHWAQIVEGPLAATALAAICVLLAEHWPMHGPRFLAALCGTSAWGYIYFGFKIGGRAALLYGALAVAYFTAAMVVANTGVPLLPALFGLHALWSAALLRRDWPAVDRRALESWLWLHLMLAGMLLLVQV